MSPAAPSGAGGARLALLGWAGVGLGAVALLLAVLAPRLVPILDPPKPIEQSVFDRAKEIRDRAAAVIKGAEPPVEPARPTDWRAVGTTAAVGLGTGAFVLGVLSFVRREDVRVAAGGAMLGTAALAFDQLSTALLVLAMNVIVAILLARRTDGSDRLR